MSTKLIAEILPASMIAELSDVLTNRGWRMGTAESCTGGGIAWALTSVSGSSEWFEGGLVSYSNRLKQQLLGVDHQLLDTYGAVSEACAKAMADGARRTLACDVAISVTGIAGPGGGSQSKPVGTVCFGWSTPEETTVQTCMFDGDRDSVRAKSIHYSITQLIDIIKL